MINKAWHKKHIMPKNASFEQRAKWHLAHQKNCSCRPILAKLAKQIKEMGIIKSDM
ncbi:MAG: hypothetical protein ACXVPU_08340 [Bacteroidia bacterium]